jgi:hypothetical protein
MAAGANIGDAGVRGGQGKDLGNGYQTLKRKRANALFPAPHGLGVVGSATARCFGVVLVALWHTFCTPCLISYFSTSLRTR